MQKIENVFAAGDIGLLKAQIGLMLESMTHDEFQQNSISYGQVGLRIGGKDYVLSNWYKGFDDYFGAEDDVPCLSFAEGMATHEEGSVPLVETAVKSKITAISIIWETVAVRPEDEDGTGLTTDEGVIIETEARQYALFKEHPDIMEFIEVLQGHDVLSKIPEPKKRWDLFGTKPVVRREIIKL